MGIAQTQALVLDLTPPAASQRHKRRIAPYPLLTTRGLHARRLGIAPEPAMLASHRLGFHAVVCHRMACSGSVGAVVRSGARWRGASRSGSLSPRGASSSPSQTPRLASGHTVCQEPA